MVRLFEGDALQILKTLPSESVDLVITSPPYFKLRDYKHLKQYGNEDKVERYELNLSKVFRECKRVLKNTGSFYLNISDTTINGKMQRVPEKLDTVICEQLGFNKRSTIIWHKPNCIPQGNKNYTKDFEYLYYYTKTNKFTWNCQHEPMQYEYKSLEYNGKETKDYKSAKAQEPSKTKKRILQGYKIKFGGNKYPNEVGGLYSGKEWVPNNQLQRVKRCVWKIPVTPIKEAHFATFPIKLVETPILASSNETDVVLDPFCGSGTVGMACSKLHRNFIGIDIIKENIELTKSRILNYNLQSSR